MQLGVSGVAEYLRKRGKDSAWKQPQLVLLSPLKILGKTYKLVVSSEELFKLQT